eukprot:2481884-Rhodomonas_salina.2
MYGMMLLASRLCACYGMPGTDIACGAVILRTCYETPSTDMAYAATRFLCALAESRARYSLWTYAPATRCPVLTIVHAATLGLSSAWILGTGTSLRTRYVMSGTDIAYGDISLCARYAMSDTDIAYGAAWMMTQQRLPPPPSKSEIKCRKPEIKCKKKESWYKLHRDFAVFPADFAEDSPYRDANSRSDVRLCCYQELDGSDMLHMGLHGVRHALSPYPIGSA